LALLLGIIRISFPFKLPNQMKGNALLASRGARAVAYAFEGFATSVGFSMPAMTVSKDF
jgi:hypothetical protein